MKQCIKCASVKEDEDFSKRGQTHRKECLSCHNAYRVEWCKRNREKRATSSHKSYAKKINKDPHECIRRKRSRAEIIQNKKDDYRRNRAKRLATVKKYAASKREIIRVYNAKWRSENRETKRLSDANWRRNNPELVTMHSNARRARKMRAMPKWLTFIQKAQIEEFYEICAARSFQTGVEHHVDHIIPLKGKAVRGLHVPWNLQVIPSAQNQSKGNRLLDA